MVIAFELDGILRSEAPGQSLDRVFAAFYDAYAGRGVGYTIEELCVFVDERLPGFGRRLAEMALQPGRLDLPSQLRKLGFEVTEGPVPYLGLVMQNEAGPAIYSVLDGSPASGSGIASEDVITSLDAIAYSLEALTCAAAHEEAVVIGVLRGNQARTYTINPGSRTTVTGLRWRGSAQQAELIAQWLARPFAPSPGQVFSLDFYENFHGIETVI